MKLLFGKKTDAITLHNVTKHKGPYRWWGLTFGFMFFGFVYADNPNAVSPAIKEQSFTDFYLGKIDASTGAKSLNMRIVPFLKEYQEWLTLHNITTMPENTPWHKNTGSK